jgi:hypothetical protein
MRLDKRLAPLGALLLAVALPACSGNSLGGLGDILGGAGAPEGQQQGQISAEVQSINTGDQLIRVTTQQGQTGDVRYDQNTVVVYQQQQYPVTALERGDVVLLQVQEDSRGNLYAGRIDVQQSVQDRGGVSSSPSSGDVREYYGRVGQIDTQRGQFMLQTQSGSITVTLPYNPPRATEDYFNRLRSGDNVRLEAVPTGTNRVEIYRFL